MNKKQNIIGSYFNKYDLLLFFIILTGGVVLYNTIKLHQDRVKLERQLHCDFKSYIIKKYPESCDNFYDQSGSCLAMMSPQELKTFTSKNVKWKDNPLNVVQIKHKKLSCGYSGIALICRYNADYNCN